MKQTKLRSYFLIGALLGAVTFIALYGVRVLDFTYDAWLLTGQDLQQHYTGWMFFRNAEWRFPLGLHDGITNPYTISVLYTDSIPLFALFFKALSPILPETFQYFGLFGILCYILNGGFAATILAKFTKSKWVCGSCSMFFILATPVLQRLYGITTETTRHTSLAAHFLILGAIAIWLHRDHFEKYWKAALAFSLLGVGCVLIQMYIIFMVGGIMCGYLLHCYLEEKNVKRIIIVLASFFLSALAVMYIVGGFSSGVSAGMGGFGEFSANVNALFNPFNYSSILPKLPMQESQYEGVSYLGLGMILMFFCVLIYMAKKLYEWKKQGNIKAKISEHYQANRTFYIPLMIVMIVFGVLAISSIVYIGKQFVISVKFPKKIEELLGVFRSSGRFMWVLMYGVMIASIAFILKKFKKKTAYGILIFCLLVQIVDLSGACRRIQKNFVREVKETKIDKDMGNDFWKQIPDTYDKVLFFPMSLFTDETVEQYLNVGAVAAKNKMTMNYFYLSRPYDKIVTKGNKQREKEFKQGQVEENALYIMDIYKAHAFRDKLNIYLVDKYIVGSKQEIAGLNPYPDLILSEQNRTYQLAVNKTSKTSPTIGHGWWKPGDEYTWTQRKGSVCILTERIRYVHVRMEYMQNPNSGETKLYLNGSKVAKIPENGSGVLEFDMDLKELRGKISNKIQMHILNIVTKNAAKVENKAGKKVKQGIAIRNIEFSVMDSMK